MIEHLSVYPVSQQQKWQPVLAAGMLIGKCGHHHVDSRWNMQNTDLLVYVIVMH